MPTTEQPALPKETKVWIYPCCMRRAAGESYTLDEGRESCTKKIHRQAAVGVTYLLKEPLEVTR